MKIWRPKGYFANCPGSPSTDFGHLIYHANQKSLLDVFSKLVPHPQILGSGSWTTKMVAVFMLMRIVWVLGDASKLKICGEHTVLLKP